MSQLERFILVGMVVSTLLGIVSHRAQSAEWSAEPSFNVKGVYNSNLILSTGSNEVWGYWTSPAVKFKGATESFMIEGNAKADFVHYYGQQDRGFTNLLFPVSTSYKWERLTFGFDGSFIRDNTLMSELRQTGLVLSFTQRNLWTANPSVTVGLTERVNWQVGYQFADATYQNGLSLGLVNYQTNGGTSELSYQIQERTKIKLIGEVTNFVASQIQETWTYEGVRVGASHDFSESLSATVLGGPKFIRSTQGGVPGGSLSQNDVVWVYNANIKQEFEQSTISLDGGRELYPSGFGLLVQTDRVSGSISHRLTENLTASLNGGLYFTTPIASTRGPFPQTRFINVNPNVTWNFAQWWTLSVGYTYAERAVGSVNFWANANSTFVMLTYTGEKWSVSR